MIWELLLAALALLVSCLAALYARWSAAEAKKANDIGRLNALLALRTHYLAQMQHQADLAQTLRDSPSGHRVALSAYADLDTKLREVSREIDKQHADIVGL
jgi:hypothetical protein